MQKIIIRIILFINAFVFFTGTKAEEISLSKNYYLKADSLISYGKYREAANMYKLCIESEKVKENPDLDRISECLNNEGVCFYKLQDYKNAIVPLEEAVKLERERGGTENLATRLSNMGLIYKTLGNYNKALEYYDQAFQIDKEIGNEDNIAVSLNNIGMIYDLWGKYDTAIVYYENSLKIKEKSGNKEGMANSINNIAFVYSSWGKYDMAIEYFKEALKIDQELGNPEKVAKRLNNLGYAYFNMNILDTALQYYQQALKIDIDIGKKDQVAVQYNNIGAFYLKTGDYNKAIYYFELARGIYDELGQKGDVATVLTNLADAYQHNGNKDKALELLEKSIQISASLKLMNQLKSNYFLISQLYAGKNDYYDAFEAYKNYSEVKDSLFNQQSHEQIADFEVRYETEKKEKEIQILRQTETIQALDMKRTRILKNSFIGGFAAMLFIAILIFVTLRIKVRSSRIIEKEKAKSDKLLLNILPAKVATDLKEKGNTKPEMFENVSVMFSDFCHFTELSSQLQPQQLIDELNDLFTGFDTIIENNHCERIKTIGDAYLAVCGLPVENPMHAINILNAGIEIIHYLEERNKDHPIQWKVRIGVHTGPAIAGVVGIKKYSYDVFGDTINTASRMESYSEMMRINVSKSTYLHAKGQFSFTERGAIDTKGKGQIDMYYLER